MNSLAAKSQMDVFVLKLKNLVSGDNKAKQIASNLEIKITFLLWFMC